MQRHKVLVFDPGGGTFDTVVLLKRSSDVVEVRMAPRFWLHVLYHQQQHSSNPLASGQAAQLLYDCMALVKRRTLFDVSSTPRLQVVLHRRRPVLG